MHEDNDQLILYVYVSLDNHFYCPLLMNIHKRRDQTIRGRCFQTVFHK